MPLQNRVDPFGQLVATHERGTMMGNRGGRFHRPDRTLGKRRWATHHWICCELHWKNTHHAAMGQGYTSLFFLDEVTALAAGHRPCFFCRRAAARRFIELAGMTSDDLDRRLHAERLGPQVLAEISNLPAGAMVANNGAPHALTRDAALPWTFSGYLEPRPRIAAMRARLLTPPAIVAILAKGYRPRWHSSAGLPGDEI
jgi:hypothetical protein